MGTKPRLGIVQSHPIQYFSPLYDLLNERGFVELSVAYWNDAGVRPTFLEGFSGVHQWDIDLLGGHRYKFLTTGPEQTQSQRIQGFRALAKVISDLDVVVIHGYATGFAAVAIAVCRARGIPYLLRSDTSVLPQRKKTSLRWWWPRVASRLSSGALAVGERNAEVHRRLGSPAIFRAPYAVDSDRFTRDSEGPREHQRATRESFGLQPDLPVIAFSGKFIDIKQPMTAVAALRELREECQLLMIGDGPLRVELEAASRDLPVVFPGFLNQSRIPVALACANVLVLPSSQEPWGLVVNEAMASGCVPVVSNEVGCAPDLVEGVGEVYSRADNDGLVLAIRRALVRSGDAMNQQRIAQRLALFSLEASAAGFEDAATQLAAKRG